jgi:hypothetical protein
MNNNVGFIDLEDIDSDFRTAENDVYKQNDIYHSFGYNGSTRAGAIRELKAMKPEIIKLSRLQRIYENRLRGSALETLSSLNRVKIDDHFLFSETSPNLVMSCRTSHVDALVMVPKDIGLDAILPCHDPGPGFTLDLRLNERRKRFKFKYSCLGFDPTGVTMFLGHCQGEDVFLSLSNILPTNAGPVARPKRLGDTTMPQTMYNIVLMFIAWSLHKAGIQDVQVNNNQAYPNGIEASDTVATATNLL